MPVRSRDTTVSAARRSPRRARWPWLLVVLALGGCTLGPSELLIIFAIVLLLFGATRLPQLGRALGETVKSFRAGAGEDENKDQAQLDGGKEVAQIEEARVEPADERRESSKSKSSS